MQMRYTCTPVGCLVRLPLFFPPPHHDFLVKGLGVVGCDAGAASYLLSGD